MVDRYVHKAHTVGMIFVQLIIFPMFQIMSRSRFVDTIYQVWLLPSRFVVKAASWNVALPLCSPRTGPKMRCEADVESFKMVPKYQLPGSDGGPKFYLDSWWNREGWIVRFHGCSMVKLDVLWIRSLMREPQFFGELVNWGLQRGGHWMKGNTSSNWSELQRSLIHMDPMGYDELWLIVAPLLGYSSMCINLGCNCTKSVEFCGMDMFTGGHLDIV